MHVTASGMLSVLAFGLVCNALYSNFTKDDNEADAICIMYLQTKFVGRRNDSFISIVNDIGK